MKLKLALAGLIAASAIASTAMAGTESYKAICDSRRLTSVDRAECHAQMAAASTNAERAKIFKTFDYKIAGFAPDGTRLAKTAPTVQEAAK